MIAVAWEKITTREGFVTYVRDVVTQVGCPRATAINSCRSHLESALERELREPTNKRVVALAVATARLALFNSTFPRLKKEGLSTERSLPTAPKYVLAMRELSKLRSEMDATRTTFPRE